MERDSLAIRTGLAVAVAAAATLAAAQQISGAAPAATVTAQREAAPKPGSPDATTTIDGRYLPPPPQRFIGQIELNATQS
jgi:arylsulfatase